MSQRLTPQEIADITGYKRVSSQEAKLRELGYIVLGRNAKNELQVLARHPGDPANAEPYHGAASRVKLNLP